MIVANRRLKIFTWHIHGSYLFYLSQGNFDIYIPVDGTNREGYYGRGKTFPFQDNVKEVLLPDLSDISFDVVLFQSSRNYLFDQFDILTEEQRSLPRIYLEHDPPWNDPADTVHVVDDPSVLVVHVTDFNRLMWDNRNNSVRVIEHGVVVPEPASLYKGVLPKGIVVVNHLHQRGRKVGADIFDEASRSVSLSLIGMETSQYGGDGEVLHPLLPEYMSHYRFFFYPVRYTSLGLALCEAMMIGMPVVALATTEVVTVIEDGVSGFIGTDPDYLIDRMKQLIGDPALAVRMGKAARMQAQIRFNIHRFIGDWNAALEEAIELNKGIYEGAHSIH